MPIALPKSLWRVAMLAIPGCTVLGAAVGSALLASSEPVIAARVYMARAPLTDTQQRITARVQVVSSESAERRAVASPIRLTLASDSVVAKSEQTQEVNAEGIAHFNLDLPEQSGRSFEVLVSNAGGRLAEGRVVLSARPQFSKPRGGWIEATGEALPLRAGVARGVLAVPFEDRLLIQAGERSEQAPIELTVKLEGAQLISPPSGVLKVKGVFKVKGGVVTALKIRPQHHVVMLHVDAQSPQARAHLTAQLPLVAGAMLAERQGPKLVVRAPQSRSRAYLDVLSPAGRLFSGELSLEETSEGAMGQLPWPLAHASGPLWVEVSSEFDMKSMAAVGWPLIGKASQHPGQTRELVQSLVLDGLVQAQGKERRRLTRARFQIGIGVLVGALLELLVLFLHVRGSQKDAKTELLRSEVSVSLPSAQGVGLETVAVLCVSLGFIALSLFFLLR